MAEGTEVHPEESATKAGDKGVKPTGKASGWIEKHKTIAYGGMALVLVVLYLFLKKGGSASSSGTTATGSSTGSSGIDPATGYLYGSPADLAALGSSGTSATTPDDGSDGSTTTTNNYYTGSTGTTSTGSSSTTNTSTANGSWTDTGQKWTLSQLAKKLGVSTSQLVPTNRLGVKGQSNPNAPLAGGAKYDIKR